jgi:hypothetical protein
MNSFKDDYLFTKTARAQELPNHVRITPFNWIQRRMSPDAIATYNDKLNVISLNSELLTKSQGKYVIKSTRAIEGNGNASAKISTIFHEMGHAEMDVFIENEREAVDSDINQYFKHVLKDFYKTHFKAFNPKHLFHEHFGYYRSDLVDRMDIEIEDLYLNNGFNRYQNRCFLNPVLRKLLEDGISLEDFKKFMLLTENKQFSKHIGPEYIYVKGKDVHLKAKNIPQQVINTTQQLFWQYHKHFYDFPSNSQELVDRMNKKSRFKDALSKCREILWNSKSEL